MCCKGRLRELSQCCICTPRTLLFNQSINGWGCFMIAKVFPKPHDCQYLILSWSVFKGRIRKEVVAPTHLGPALLWKSTRGLSLLLPPLLSFTFVPLLTLRSACPCLPPSSFLGAACLFGYFLGLYKDRKFLVGFLGLVPTWGGIENKPGATYKWEAWRSHTLQMQCFRAEWGQFHSGRWQSSIILTGARGNSSQLTQRTISLMT